MIILGVLWIQQSHESTERLCCHCGWESYRIIIRLALGRTGCWRRQCEHIRKERCIQPATWDSEQSIFGLQKADLSPKFGGVVDDKAYQKGDNCIAENTVLFNIPNWCCFLVMWRTLWLWSRLRTAIMLCRYLIFGYAAVNRLNYVEG